MTTGLARETVGLREVLFQSITHMAPAAAVAFSIPFGAPFAGGALPLSVLLALVACLLVALSIGQLARHLPSAGGFFTYTSRGLHPAVGFLVAWGYAFVEPLVAPLLFLIFGNVVGGVLRDEFGWSFGTWWVVAAVVAAVVVGLFGWYGIRVSTRAGTILGLFEIAVFAALALWLIAKAGSNTLGVFGTRYATVKGFGGASGVVAGSVYAILAFIGFEAAAPLAEEAVDPRRTIKLAVVWSALAIGLFYVLTTYAASAWFGPGKFAGFSKAGGGDPWTFMARAVWGAGWVAVFLAIANSAIANSNAGANATTRTWYAMGRIRLLPSALATVHPRHRSPHVAVAVQFVVGVAVAIALGEKYGPLTAFGFVATINVAVIVLIYMLVNLSCLAYYLRERRFEFNPLLHGLVPVLGILAFVPAFLTAVGVGGSVLHFVAKLPYPLSLVGIIDGAWYVLGIVFLAYLYRVHPERVEQTGRVFVEAPEPASRLARARARGRRERPVR
jgi:amino acid transporter